jgi:hypothetical protein
MVRCSAHTNMANRRPPCAAAWPACGASTVPATATPPSWPTSPSSQVGWCAHARVACTAQTHLTASMVCAASHSHSTHVTPRRPSCRDLPGLSKRTPPSLLLFMFSLRFCCSFRSPVRCCRRGQAQPAAVPAHSAAHRSGHALAGAGPTPGGAVYAWQQGPVSAPHLLARVRATAAHPLRRLKLAQPTRSHHRWSSGTLAWSEIHALCDGTDAASCANMPPDLHTTRCCDCCRACVCMFLCQAGAEQGGAAGVAAEGGGEGRVSAL